MIVRSLFAAFALVATAAPALAREEVAIQINVTDIDLSSTSGREQFEARVKSAARSACRTEHLTPGAKAAEERCVDELVASAQAKLD